MKNYEIVYIFGKFCSWSLMICLVLSYIFDCSSKWIPLIAIFFGLFVTCLLVRFDEMYNGKSMEDRYQEALKLWFEGKYKESTYIFLTEIDSFYISAGTIDIEDKQGRAWALYFGDWLMNYDEPSAIQNYPPGARCC